MKLRELRDRLTDILDSGVDPDVEVYTEGCDCFGDVGSVDVDCDTSGCPNKVGLMRGVSPDAEYTPLPPDVAAAFARSEESF